ncbi:MAG: SAM hydrolase/SAM-dependent halogenase family protein [Candidatus Bathyarchaeia archaeon]|jgi:S-adenosylmethionine hydrolase
MITLTTDFGLKDPYVAEMKGVILGINPDAKVVDVSHSVDKFDVRMATFMLASAAPYFPDGTVHLAVVDPGVGTARRAIVVQTKRGFFVGPDNGVLMLAAQAQTIEHIYELTNSKYMLPEVSGTFHGRDIFAPAAAYIDKGVNPEVFGPEIADPIIPKFTHVEQQNGVLHGEVLHIDGFGNVITNLTRNMLPQTSLLKVVIHSLSFQLALAKAYGQSKPLEVTALIGSHGFLELALNQGSFADKYQINIGCQVEVAPA